MKKFNSSIVGLIVTLLVLTLIAFLYFQFVNSGQMPVYFWAIPVFFLVISGVLGLIENTYAVKNKELSIASILGIRVFFVALIGVFVFIMMLLDREHIWALTILSVFYALKFLYFETRILLKLNKQ